MRSSVLLVATFVCVFGLSGDAVVYAQSAPEAWAASEHWQIASNGDSRFLALTEIGMVDPSGDGTPRMMRFLIGCRDQEVGVLVLDSTDRPVIAFLPGGALVVDKTHPGALVGCVNASLRLKIGHEGPSYSVVSDDVGHQVSIDPSGLIAAVTRAEGITLRLKRTSDSVVVGRSEDGSVLRVGLGRGLWRHTVPYVFFDGARSSGRVTTFLQTLEYGGDAGAQQSISLDSTTSLMMAVRSQVNGPNPDGTSPLSSAFEWLDTDRRYLQASELLWKAWPFRNQDLASRLQKLISAIEADTESFASEEKAIASISAIRSLINTKRPPLGWLGTTSFSDRCLYPVIPRSVFRHHLEVYVGKAKVANLVKTLTQFAASTTSLSLRRDALVLLFRLGLTSPECTKLAQIAQEWPAQGKLITAAILMVNGDASLWDEQHFGERIANVEDLPAASLLLETFIFLETEPPVSVVERARKWLVNEPDAEVRTHVIALLMQSEFGRRLILKPFSEYGTQMALADDVLTVMSATSPVIRNAADKPLLVDVCDRCRAVCLDVNEIPDNRTHAALVLKGVSPASATIISTAGELWSRPDRTSRQLAMKLRQSRSVGKWAESDWKMIGSAAAAADSQLRREAVLTTMFAVVTAERQESLRNREKAYSILEVTLADADAEVRRAALGVLLIFSKRGITLPARLLGPLVRASSADESTESLRLAAYLAHELSPDLISWPPFADRYPRRPFQWETDWWDEHSSEIRQDFRRAVLQPASQCQ